MEKLLTEKEMYSILVPALFTLAGIFISAFVSWGIAKMTSKSLMRSEKNKINHEYAKILMQKRMEIYPDLWRLISDIYGIKKLKIVPGIDGIAHNRDLIRPQLREWRKKYGLFLSVEGTFELRDLNFQSQKKSFLKRLLTFFFGEKHNTISSYKAFCNLEEALYVRKEAKSYYDDRILKIDQYRNVLLKTLKNDIGILEKSEKNIKKELLEI